MATPEEVMQRIGTVLLECRAALFMPEPCRLWIGGKEVAIVTHYDGGCGHEFTVEHLTGKC